jgi:hypothetical protein
MKRHEKLFAQIKDVRCRNAEDLHRLCAIAVACIKAIQSIKNLQTIPIRHRNRQYFLLRAKTGNNFAITRPVRDDLFIWEADRIEDLVNRTLTAPWESAKADGAEQMIYTLQQAVAMYLDIFHQSAAPRVVGTFFEAVIACSLNLTSGLEVISGTVQIPDTDESIMMDLGLKKGDVTILLVATKTSTRERLSQPFVQKRILDQALLHPPKSVLIVVGDVQRLRTDRVQHTFTPGQFLLYWKYITPLDGVYYIDVPPQAESEAFAGRVKRLRQLLSTDLNTLLS